MNLGLTIQTKSIAGSSPLPPDDESNDNPINNPSFLKGDRQRSASAGVDYRDVRKEEEALSNVRVARPRGLSAIDTTFGQTPSAITTNTIGMGSNKRISLESGKTPSTTGHNINRSMNNKILASLPRITTDLRGAGSSHSARSSSEFNTDLDINNEEIKGFSKCTS